MATLPNNPLFNISDTNYLGVGFGASDSMGRTSTAYKVMLKCSPCMATSYCYG